MSLYCIVALTIICIPEIRRANIWKMPIIFPMLSINWPYADHDNQICY